MEQVSTSKSPMQSYEMAPIQKQARPINGIYAAIIALMCFFPTGLVAIVYAIKARKALDYGYMDDSDQYMRLTRGWTIWSIAIFAIHFISGMGVWIFRLIILSQR